MFCLISIITGGVVYNCEWEETDSVSLEEYIKEECYGATNQGDKAIVNVEVMEVENSREYGNNLPDGERGYSQVKCIDNLCFIYDDIKTELTLMASHQTHKSLKNKNAKSTSGN